MRKVQVVLFTIWAILLPLLWLVFLPGLGMMFDATPTAGTYVFVFCIGTFPVAVIVAWILKERAPAAVFLPLLNLLVPVLLDFLAK